MNETGGLECGIILFTKTMVYSEAGCVQKSVFRLMKSLWFIEALEADCSVDLASLLYVSDTL